MTSESGDYGYTVQCTMFHPMAQMFPALRSDPNHQVRGILTVAPSGEDEFIVCDDEHLHRLIYATGASRRLWRTSDGDVLNAKIAEITELFGDVPRWSSEFIWDIEEYEVPDEQAILRMIQGERVTPSRPIPSFRL